MSKNLKNKHISPISKVFQPKLVPLIIDKTKHESSPEEHKLRVIKEKQKQNEQEELKLQLERLQLEAVLKRKQKIADMASQRSTSEKKITFDHMGKILFVKKIKEDALLQDIKPKIIVKKQFKLERMENRLEDVPPNEAVQTEISEMVKHSIDKKKPLIQRLKQSRGTLDITNPHPSLTDAKPSNMITLKPGVQLKEKGGPTKFGPKIKIENRMNIQEYVAKAKRNILNRIETLRSQTQSEVKEVHNSIDEDYRPELENQKIRLAARLVAKKSTPSTSRDRIYPHFADINVKTRNQLLVNTRSSNGAYVKTSVNPKSISNKTQQKFNTNVVSQTTMQKRPMTGKPEAQNYRYMSNRQNLSYVGKLSETNLSADRTALVRNNLTSSGSARRSNRKLV